MIDPTVIGVRLPVTGPAVIHATCLDATQDFYPGVISDGPQPFEPGEWCEWCGWELVPS